MRILILLLATALWLGPGPIRAAESGDFGPESRARFTISLALQPSLEITTATDIAINIADRSVDTSYRQPFCVRGTIDTKYTVTAFGETDSDGQFVLRSDDETLPFDVAYVGDPSTPRADPLEPAVPSPAYDILDHGSDCGDATWFVVTFDADDLEFLGSGLYSGAVTFLVSPV